jgi:hypothetical protein
VVVVFTIRQQSAASLHRPALFLALGTCVLPFGLLWVGGRHRKAVRYCLALLTLGLILWLNGCGGTGGNSSSGSANPNAAPSSAASVQSSLPVTLSVAPYRKSAPVAGRATTSVQRVLRQSL